MGKWLRPQRCCYACIFATQSLGSLEVSGDVLRIVVVFELADQARHARRDQRDTPPVGGRQAGVDPSTGDLLPGVAAAVAGEAS